SDCLRRRRAEPAPRPYRRRSLILAKPGKQFLGTLAHIAPAALERANALGLLTPGMARGVLRDGFATERRGGPAARPCQLPQPSVRGFVHIQRGLLHMV